MVPASPRSTLIAAIATPFAIFVAAAIITDQNGWTFKERGPNLATELRKGKVQYARAIEAAPDAIGACLERADSIALPLQSVRAGGSVSRALVNEPRHVAVMLIARANSTIAVVSAPQPPSASEETVLGQCLTGRPIAPPRLRFAEDPAPRRP